MRICHSFHDVRRRALVVVTRSVTGFCQPRGSSTVETIGGFMPDLIFQIDVSKCRYIGGPIWTPTTPQRCVDRRHDPRRRWLHPTIAEEMQMEKHRFGTIGEVSRLTLGGGGIGQVWGGTSREEGIATLKMAVDAGIDVIDAAPGYKVCEALIGEAFDGRLPEGVRITTKCGIGSPPAHEVYARFRTSLEQSLAAMRLERVDLFFLHNEICPDDFVYPVDNERRAEFATTWSLYCDAVVPAFERLHAEGLIGAWGITGVGVPAAIVDALERVPRPQAVQAAANLLDSPGGLTRLRTPARPREIIATAQKNGVGVMGIRAVQAGALTRAFDRPLDADHADAIDFPRAAPFRALCEKWGADPAIVAHRYALGIAGVDTLVLGVKNREELGQCLDAERAGPLSPQEIAAIDALGLRG
jgi:aryl-alcohol dehydrogenase-like predicted oxidoreductase